VATLEIVHQITMDFLNGDLDFGNRRTPVNMTVGGQVFDTGAVTIADNYTRDTLWETGDGGLDGFDMLLFISTYDVFIELTNTTPATDENVVLFVAANIPLILPSRYIAGYASGTSRLDGSAMVEDTDFGDITAIRVQRNAADAAGDASVRLVLID